ncbi:type III-B CRISPR-associated protein Cas10/Cmr2 [Thermostichus vulcanus]|uniref:Type III-B CRISPR-associated protein Cas10/Cmr2 n=1 Tax=Thermostichus vulcanus str. 'Rupite' TaxID=2813851 RepID=A0ABT0C706_THEVL|nr:type III-B CRISPR-associated protein Cas10/Cmr2 [Thermostichus vulcanus]MCJ2541566.1 type III-B CRISPR-associated protein Cas10/Cmr2 [Thermostichus vulcanus str. 'Rupite']
MSYYWQAKIWGLLHDPALKALHDQSGRGGEGVWPRLAVMEGWQSPKSQGANSLAKYIGDSDLIASASDRSAIGHLPVAVDYQTQDRGVTLGIGLEMSHLLSGTKTFWQLSPDEHRDLHQANNRAEYLRQREETVVPAWIWEERDPQKVFWWFWRCFPQAICQEFGDESLMLMPAETRLPDGSIWTHASITAALAGSLAGYTDLRKSHPYLASFTFSPIQELIKASRKMRDFWAGSWLLHYLSACICWKLALKYGPDCVLYPSLYAQPLIDYWLLQKYPQFSDWVEQPQSHKLLTAGFPNVILVILPQEKVQAAMQLAQQTLLEEWRNLSDQVFSHLQEQRRWMQHLSKTDPTWQGWLEQQWQHYWAAVPIGDLNSPLKDTGILKSQDSIDQDPWVAAQNQTYHLSQEQKLFLNEELAFLRRSFLDEQGNHRQYKSGANVGSWWAAVVDQTRRVQAACKNPRDWELPVAFGPRSTISGIGPVVHPTAGNRWLTEGESRRYWGRSAGLFDGREQLNATETVKRGLHKILPALFPALGEDEGAIAACYPDLTAGVAGYLKTQDSQGSRHYRHFQRVCQAILNDFPWARQVIREMQGKWGIPWADQRNFDYHPRLLNAGWLVEDADTPELRELEAELEQERDSAVRDQLNRDILQIKRSYRQGIERIISRFYPGVNPASWYVLAAGDGDDMSEWLKGSKMKPYFHYLPQPIQNLAEGREREIGKVIHQKELQEVRKEFSTFVKTVRKRMGPATHSALSRALLDFSNQLVPYLTEQRYAGRLIYGGGDDVLAYLNLWEWDSWLWDIRQCFRGDRDDAHEFDNQGNYWTWQKGDPPPGLSRRPLFTMGSEASISFGVVIAHESVPLAIALENLWEAESEAKKHQDATGNKKDAVQVRVLYANGNQLKATSKFDTFNLWKDLLDFDWKLLNLEDDQSSLFEQAAQLWEQHPAPIYDAIMSWVNLFCERRDLFKGDPEGKQEFKQKLCSYLEHLWNHTQGTEQVGKRDEAIKNWLKLAAFIVRNRHITIQG